MVFTCGEEIENVTGFFEKHFVRAVKTTLITTVLPGMFQLVSCSFRPNISLNFQ